MTWVNITGLSYDMSVIKTLSYVVVSEISSNIIHYPMLHDYTEKVVLFVLMIKLTSSMGKPWEEMTHVRIYI